MDGLERVRRAIHFQGPDHIPHYLPDESPNDIVWLGPPRPETGRATAWREVETGRWRRYDEWGTLWERFGPSGNGEVLEPALADWARLDETLRLLGSVPPLEPLMAHRDQILNDAGAHYFLGVLQYPSIYATGHDLRGLVPFLTDLYEHPAELGRLLDRLAESQIMCVDLLADCGVHGIMGYDDWGMQDRTFISPQLWGRFFAPRYRAVWEHAHARGLDVWLHSCGYILPLLPLMMDCGLNVAQLDQQENMGLENLERVAGGRLAFWCPADIQTVMARGTEAEIEAYVRRMIYHLGRLDGGFISMAYSSPQDIHHTPDRIAAMCRAFRRWGVYPLADVC